MLINRKKIVAFLAIIAVGSGAMVVVSSRSSTNRPNTANSQFKVGSLFANDPNFSAKTSPIAGNNDLFFKMMSSILLVAALGAAAIYASKRIMPRITNLPGKQMRIVETIYLGPRKTIHLLKIGEQRLLIGCTNETMTKLADVTDMFTEDEETPTELSVHAAGRQ